MGGGAAWKHREETALHPDSVTENKDNLFPSHSITQSTVLLMETQCCKVQHSDTSETINILTVKKKKDDTKHFSIQNQARTRILVVMLSNQELCKDKAYQSGNMGVGDTVCVCVFL